MESVVKWTNGLSIAKMTFPMDPLDEKWIHLRPEVDVKSTLLRYVASRNIATGRIPLSCIQSLTWFMSAPPVPSRSRVRYQPVLVRGWQEKLRAIKIKGTVESDRWSREIVYGTRVCGGHPSASPVVSDHFFRHTGTCCEVSVAQAPFLLNATPQPPAALRRQLPTCFCCRMDWRAPFPCPRHPRRLPNFDIFSRHGKKVSGLE